MISLSTGNPMRVVLMAVLIFEVIVFGLAIPVMIMISDVPAAAAGGIRRWGGGAGHPGSWTSSLSGGLHPRLGSPSSPASLWDS